MESVGHTHSSAFILEVCSGVSFQISLTFSIELCMHECVWERKLLRTSSISSILIMWCVYLEAGRRSAMWFVDVHSYKLPSPSSVFMEHLWHKDSTWGAEHTHKKKPAHRSKYWTKLKHAHLPFGYIFIKHLWPQKKKAEGITHTDIHAHTKTAW